MWQKITNKYWPNKTLWKASCIILQHCQDCYKISKIQIQCTTSKPMIIATCPACLSHKQCFLHPWKETMWLYSSEFLEQVASYFMLACSLLGKNDTAVFFFVFRLKSRPLLKASTFPLISFPFPSSTLEKFSLLLSQLKSSLFNCSNDYFFFTDNVQ